MKRRTELLLLFALVLVFAPGMQAQVATSRQVPFNKVASTLAGCTPAPCTQPASVDVQVWDDATSTLPADLILTEQHRGASPGSAVVDDGGNLTFLLGSQLAAGLPPDQFTSGSSRFLDVVDATTGASVLTGSRMALNAVAFAINPGPKGDQGIPGIQGQPGPPGVVQTVTAGDTSITVSGTAADRVLSIANGALTPAKVAGTAATLGSNSFVGAQTIIGNLLVNGVVFNTNGGFPSFEGVTDLNLISRGDNSGTVKFWTTTGGITRNRMSIANNGNLDVNGAINSAAQYNIGGARMLATGASNTNVFVGVGAGSAISTGYGNTFLGQDAGAANDIGLYNTFGGLQVGKNNKGGQENSFFGVFAGFKNTQGNYGAFFGGDAGFENTTGSGNSFFGRTAGYQNDTGSGNTFIGFEAGSENTSGSFNTYIGYDAGRLATPAGITNATALGYGASVNASNKIRLGNDAVTVIEGRVPYTWTSDKNQKENFQPVEGEQVLRKIGALNLTSWNYIGHDPKQFRHYGPVAQEFFGAFGHDAIGTIGNSTTINSGDMEGILMIGVQTLEKRTADLRQENQSLKAENAELKARLEAIERRLGGKTIK